MHSSYLRLLVALLWVLALVKVPVSGLPVACAAPSEPHPRGTQPPSSDLVKSLQRELKRAGYHPGVADGKMGPATQRALKRFQEDHGLPPSGDPDIPTLTKLLEQDLPH